MILAQTILAKWPTRVENVPAIGDSFLQLDGEWPGCDVDTVESVQSMSMRLQKSNLGSTNIKSMKVRSFQYSESIYNSFI